GRRTRGCAAWPASRRAAGRSNRQIGEELFIAGKTASVHVSNILAKLGAASRTEAVAIAYREGLIGREEAVG
ncbi:response regulator transcription factor, partial [Streptomyces nigra]|uniref:response regulator transcription factor n=1 Tax=Streptomyces nigra TaxID=1827580 RepID=UPI00341FB24C